MNTNNNINSANSISTNSNQSNNSIGIPDIKTRISIARKIACGMEFLHENKLYHLHLSSRNIYMKDINTPMIADYGFHHLKEISSLFNKYKNKNSYSSPEVLRETQSTIVNKSTGSSKTDVYSFGILLWELYTLKIPFNVKLSNLYTYVVVNNYRPEIPSDINMSIAELIRACWDSDVNKRPSFKKIIEILDKVEL